MPSQWVAPLDPTSVAELKSYLRLDGADEDDLLERLIRSSMSLCETFIGQTLLLQTVWETLRLNDSWKQLSASPVQEVESVDPVGGTSQTTPLPPGQWTSEILDDGIARVKISAPPGRFKVTYKAGMAETWDGLPEPLRHGIIRLSAHLYTYRDAAEDRGPPAVVAALWKPWRRYRLA